jgi:hypothetical protein
MSTYWKEGETLLRDRIVLYGKRVRKPKEIDISKPEYGNGTRCTVTRQDTFFIVNNKKVLSYYTVSVYESSNSWCMSNKDRCTPIKTKEEAKKYVEESFGGQWKWDKPKISTKTESSHRVEIYNELLIEWESLEKLFLSTERTKRDMEWYNSIKHNISIGFNWLKSSMSNDGVDEFEISRFLVEKYLDTLRGIKN